MSNLIEILSVATGETFAQIEARYDGKGYGDLKGDVGEAVVELLRPLRERYTELRADPGELERILGVGAAKARETVRPTSTPCTSAWDSSARTRPTAAAPPTSSRVSSRHSPGASAATSSPA